MRSLKNAFFYRYYTESKDFRLYNPTNCIVIIRRDVVFDENIGWKWDSNNKISQVIVENEAFPSDEVSQSLANS